MALTPGVYIGKSNISPFDLISTGDFISPVVPSFRLTDTGGIIYRYNQLHFIINNVYTEVIKLNISGSVSNISVDLSFDNVNYSNLIELSDPIDALNRVETRSFWVRFGVTDIVDLFVLSRILNDRTHKLRLIWG